MCLMITKPAGVKIKKAYLQEAFRRNSDGAGIAVAMGEKVLVIKPLWEFKDLWKVYEKFELHPLLIHCRIKTHGSKCRDNTHPHQITKDLAMAHNGIIVKATTEGDESDTRAYIRSRIMPVLQEHGKWGVVSEENLKLYDSEIGSSKLAFMNSLGHFSYANKRAGHEHEGCWWSNHSYKAVYVQPSSTTNYQSNAYKPHDISTEMVYCVGCRSGHQRRNTCGWYLNNADLVGAGVTKYATGMSLFVCHECCDKHKLDSMSTGGWITSVAKVPPSFYHDLREYVDLLKKQDEFSEQQVGTCGSHSMVNRACDCCGLKLHNDCVQPIYDPTITERKVIRHVCRMCIGKIGLKNYWPSITETIGQQHRVWKYLVKCQKNAEASYNKMHPKVVDDTVFPEWIEKSKNLLTPKPADPKPVETKPTETKQTETTSVTQVNENILTAAAGKVMHRGWCCTMCGESRLTVLTNSNDRLCLECNEAYADAGFNWSDAAQAIAISKNLMKNGGKLILPPIPGTEVSA